MRLALLVLANSCASDRLRSGFSMISQRSEEHRPESSFKRDPVSLPAPRIGQFEMSALPPCPSLRALNVGSDGADNRDNDVWIEPPNHCAESRFALRPRQPALFPGQPVDRASAQIDQVAIQLAK